MFKDKPFLGFGKGGFMAHYMDYQADYFSNQINSPFSLLADNVNNPFNEFVLVLVNYGLIGLLTMLLLIGIVIKRLYLITSKIRVLLLGITAAILIEGLFSYPSGIPYIWVIAGLIALIAFTPKNNDRHYLLSWSSVLLCAFSILYFTPQLIYERRWKNIEKESLDGKTEEMLEEYQKLHKRLDSNGYFLYNYGAELYHCKQYNQSLAIMKECSAFLNDYDVQMLLGSNCEKLGDTTAAISYFTHAGKMVPSKFLSHYCLMNLYIEMGDSIKALDTAEHIVSMNVKVKRSGAVKQIIKEANDYIKRSE